MCRTVLGEIEIHFRRHHEERKSYGGKTIFERDLTLEDTMGCQY